MHVLSITPLKEFWETHPQAKGPLRAWYGTATRADWTCFADVRRDYSSADTVSKFVVFNLGGNKYRLTTAIHFNRRKVYVRTVLTHTEYDRDKWKEE